MNGTTVETVTTRANPMIDPSLAIWGWEIPVYLFLGGLVAGLMVLLVALEWRMGDRPKGRYTQWVPFAAIGLLSVGMGALFLDLEYKVHVLRFYTAFQVSSPMSWGSWLLIAVYPALALHGVGMLDASTRDRLRSWRPMRWSPLARLLSWTIALADAHRGAVAWAVFVLGLGLGTYTGLLLGTSTARALWNSALLGPLFMASGVSTGAAFLLLTGLADREAHLVVRWDMAAIVLELALLLLLVLGFVTGPSTTQTAGEVFLGGTWTPWFWVLVVFAGLVVPLMLDTVELKRRLPATLAAPLLVLAGGLALRVVLVYAGQSIPFEALP